MTSLSQYAIYKKNVYAVKRLSMILPGLFLRPQSEDKIGRHPVNPVGIEKEILAVLGY